MKKRSTQLAQAQLVTEQTAKPSIPDPSNLALGAGLGLQLSAQAMPALAPGLPRSCPSQRVARMQQGIGAHLCGIKWVPEITLPQCLLPRIQPTGAKWQHTGKDQGKFRAGLKWGSRLVWVGVPGEADQDQ